VIVIVGGLGWRGTPPAAPAGRACGVALAAAARGARVELVGRVGEDPAGESLLLALARAGVGHAAVLRDPVRATPVSSSAETAPDDDAEASPMGDGTPVAVPPATADGPRLEGADVDLAVRYLEPSGVMVVTDDVPSEALAACVESAHYAELRLVVLVAPSGRGPGGAPSGLPDTATVLAAPEAGGGESGAFELLVGAYAAALDAGAEPVEAFRAAQGVTGWEVAAAD
jgi:ribokinase